MLTIVHPSSHVQKHQTQVNQRNATTNYVDDSTSLISRAKASNTTRAMGYYTVFDLFFFIFYFFFFPPSSERDIFAKKQTKNKTTTKTNDTIHIWSRMNALCVVQVCLRWECVALLIRAHAERVYLACDGVHSDDTCCGVVCRRRDRL